MYPWYRRVSLVIAFALIAVKWVPAEQGQGGECRPLSLYVRDSNGAAVPDALVVVENMWTAPTNYEGIATIKCKPGMRPPLSVEITARGFKPLASILGSTTLGEADIILERERTALPASTTVSAGELSEKVQQESSKLQEQAVEALDRGDNAGAEQLLRRALDLTPSTGKIYNNIGVALLRQGSVENAAAWFEKAVKLSPYDPQLVGNLGMIRWVQNRAEDSHQLLDRAVAARFSTPVAHYILGVTSLRKGKLELAIKQLRKTDPQKYPLRDLYLAIAHHAEGKSRDASRSYGTFMTNVRVPLYLSYTPRVIETHSRAAGALPVF